MPVLVLDTLHESTGHPLRMRLETPLAETDDTLFVWDLKKLLQAA